MLIQVFTGEIMSLKYALKFFQKKKNKCVEEGENKPNQTDQCWSLWKLGDEFMMAPYTVFYTFMNTWTFQ